VRRPTDIGAYTFIGPHSVVMPGSRIGRGVLVKAYSYVDGEVPDFAVVAGQPAVVVGDTRELTAPGSKPTRPARHYDAWAGGADAMRLVLIGDGDSPHLLKWARALSSQCRGWTCGRCPAAASCPASTPCCRRRAGWRWARGPTPPAATSACCARCRAWRAWLRQVQPDWLHAHYLTSHGTLAWLARAAGRRAGAAGGSAWGSDILVTPTRSAAWRWLTRECCAPAR
jgi:hypothetical protein